MSSKFITRLSIVLLLMFSIWYVFTDTLSFSQLVGKTNSPTATIFINLFDFDTGLTRYDVYNLKSRAPYWEKRMQQVASINDPTQRQIENEKLLAEMMQDPPFKKIARNFFGLSGKSALAVLKGITVFTF